MARELFLMYFMLAACRSKKAHTTCNFDKYPLSKLYLRRLLAGVSIFLISMQVALSQHESSDNIYIDSIAIEKNWYTRDKIILRELDFTAKETVSKQQMETAVVRIWNIGNFVDVGYNIDTLEDKSVVMRILARDAFTIMPIVGFSGSNEDNVKELGIYDSNFLGRNINFRIESKFGTLRNNYDLNFALPRQMLYGNMTLSFTASVGKFQNYRYSEGEKISGVGYSADLLSLDIGNPYHEDFYYTFSPDIGLSLFQHKTNSSLITEGVATCDDYNVSYLSISVSESIGIVNKMRHQQYGALASMSHTFGIGLNNESLFYYSLDFEAQYHKLFNKVVQFSSSFNSSYTTSNLPSLIYYRGASDVLGIRTGEISGKAFYSAYIGGHFTYLNKNWGAIEHSVYVNWGNGNDNYLSIYTTKPIVGVGTGLQLMIPTVPWMVVHVNFSYTGKNSNWLHIQI